MTIELRNLTKRFANQLVVNHIDLTINNSELFVLLGSSGSGKSTILRIIAGLLHPDQGTVHLHGQDVTNLPPQKRNTGFVFQNYAIFKHMSVASNVEFGLKVRGVARSERRQRCADLLELVGLGGLGNRLPSQLSGGQRQRVALARALAYEPSVLLLDEPFGALDLKIRSQLRQHLRLIQRQLKVTTILVTHDQEEAFELGDRIGVLEHGRLVEANTPVNLYWKPRSEFAATFIGGGNVLVGRAEQGAIRLGTQLLEPPTDSPPHEEGAPVRVLFRPETVHYQSSPVQAESGLTSLGLGKLTDVVFNGPVERLKFELDTLQGIRPLAPTRQYGQHRTSIYLTCSADQNANPIRPIVGNSYWIGLDHYHILEPSGLRFLVWLDSNDWYAGALETTRLLAEPSHGLALLLRISPGARTDAADQQLLARTAQQLSPEGDLQVQLLARQGRDLEQIILAAQQAYPDIILLGRPEHPTPAAVQQLARITRKLLMYSGTAVLLTVEPPKQLKRILVCTAAGEPGKDDITFTARIARHIGAFIEVLHVLRPHASTADRERAERHLSGAAAVLNSYGLTHAITLMQADPIIAIQERFTNGNFDLIVLGAAGESRGPRPERDLVTDVVLTNQKAALIVPLRS